MSKKKKHLSVSQDLKRQTVIGFVGLLALTIGQASYAAQFCMERGNINVEHLINNQYSYGWVNPINRNILHSTPIADTTCDRQFHPGTCKALIIKNNVSGNGGGYDATWPEVTLAPTRIEWIQFYLSAILALFGIGSSVWQWNRV